MKQMEIDIRIFRRYAKEVGFRLSIGPHDYAAKTVDYSLNSLGIVIEKAPPLKRDDMIDLDIPDLGIRQKGRVIWSSRHGDAARAGVERVGPLSGNLSLYRLSDLLIGFQRTLKTGVLLVREGQARREIFLSRGNMIFASSNLDRDRIGDVLLREGLLTREQYNRADARKKKTNERYVFILVDSGFLKPSDLMKVLELQAFRILESLFTLSSAEFEFREGPLPPGSAVALNIPASDLVYHELKKTADEKKVSKHLLNRIVSFSATPLNLFQKITLEDDDRRLLSCVDGRTSVRDIIRMSGADESGAMRGIYALVEARILEVGEPGAEASGPVHAEEVAAQSEDEFGGLIDRIDEAHARYRTLSLYDVLGVHSGSPADEIKKAYYRAAKEYHPDRHFSLPEDIKAKLIDIFNIVTNAYLTLKDAAKRREYDSSLQAASAADAKKTAAAPDEGAARETPPAAPQPQSDSQSEEIARGHFNEGRQRFRKGRIEEATHEFATAIYFDGSRAEYHHFYGLCLAKSDKPKDALQSLQHAFELSPKFAESQAETGHIYLGLNCPVRAKGSFERALKLDPSNKRALEGLELLRMQETKKKK